MPLQTHTAITGLLARDARALAEEFANATEYEAAGIMLRLSLGMDALIGDAALKTAYQSMLTDACIASGFSRHRIQIRNFSFSLDNAMREIA